MRNPEFTKNLWLELSPLKMIAAAVLLGIIFFLPYAVGSTFSFFSGPIYSYTFIAVTALYGYQLAANSVINEAKEGTWDLQRMSALGPWQLTWGKLFGSTIFAWYCGLLSMAMIFEMVRSGRFALPDALILILGALLLQSIGFLGSLKAVETQRRSGGPFRTGLILQLVLASLIYLPYRLFGHMDPFRWNGLILSGDDFKIAMLVYFDLWIVYGAYRLMRREFHIENTFIPWAVFSIMTVLCFGDIGAIVVPSNTSVQVWVSASRVWGQYGIALVIGYIALFSEEFGPLKISKFLDSFDPSGKKKPLVEMPLWVFSAALLVVIAIALNLFPGEKAEPVALIAMTLFFLRDIVIVNLIGFSANRKQVEISAITLLILLYTLPPYLLKSIGLMKATALFWPRSGSLGIASVVAVSAELVILLAVFWAQWKRFKALHHRA